MTKWTFVFLILILMSCGVTKRNSDCDNVIENVSNKIRYNDSLRIYEYTHKEDLLKMENNIDVVDNKNCFKGMKLSKLKQLLGPPNYSRGNIVQYYFLSSCYFNKVIPCRYWEFIINSGGRINYFFERSLIREKGH